MFRTQYLNKPPTGCEAGGGVRKTETRTYMPMMQQILQFQATGLGLSSWRSGLYKFHSDDYGDDLDDIYDPTVHPNFSGADYHAMAVELDKRMKSFKERLHSREVKRAMERKLKADEEAEASSKATES